MPIIKCKMCGGDLNIIEGSTVAECEYCGTKQTVPSADNEKKLTLFARAGRLLRACEFDKAAGVFESIVADFPEEAEAYWGLVLCKYGIEYVNDPATGKKIPTCHRSSFDSVLDDANFEQACENTDAVARRVYRDEARQIEDLRQAILQVSGKEEPYDVFISYKETDENGERTLDSVIAQDIYTELTERGYRVFFSRISLEEKLGTEYEPYIFAALNSAKVMLVVGTDYENFDSVWVKNEWSRFLKLIASGQKKTLIPVFKNMDAYDMPKEFAKLAAQDMGKVGAMQDLVRGVEKIVGRKKPETVKETVVVQQGEGSMKTAAAVKRGYLALEEGEFDAAKEFFNQALTLDAECAEAYLGLALANEQEKNEDAYIQNSCAKKGSKEALEIPPELRRIDKVTAYNYIPNFLSTTELKNIFDFNLKYLSAVKTQTEIAKQEKARFENNRNLNRAFRFAKGETAERLESFKARLFEGVDRNVAIAKEEADAAHAAKEKAYAAHLQASEEKAAALHKQAEKKRDAFYQAACKAQTEASSIADYEAVQDDFRKLGTYYDASERVQQCQLSIQQLQEQQRLKKEAEEKAAAEEAERQRVIAARAEAAENASLKKKRIIAAILAVAAVAAYLIVTKVINPNNQYKAAEALFEAGKYEEAIAAFAAMNGYKDSADRILQSKYAAAEAMLKAGQYEKAVALFESLNGYSDSNSRIDEINGAILDRKYDEAEEIQSSGDILNAALAFGQLGDYQDAHMRSFSLWEQIADRKTIAVGSHHVVGIRTNGTVLATGRNDSGQCDVTGWSEIVAVAAGNDFTMGLRADGTVLIAGNDHYFAKSIADCTDIVAISAMGSNMACLHADGTVSGSNDYWGHLPNMTGIIAIAVGPDYIAGLTNGGTVKSLTSKATGRPPELPNTNGIISIASGESFLLGLLSNGKVIMKQDSAVYHSKGLFFTEWTDIVAIAEGDYHSVGLKSDGTVIAYTYEPYSGGKHDMGQGDVSAWDGIVAIAAGGCSTVGLTSNGTVVIVGEISNGECDVSRWSDIKLPNT